MKILIAIVALLVSITSAQTIPDLGPCINSCVAGVERNLQAPKYGCQGLMDYACFCRTPDFAFGVRDCTNEACGGGGAASAQAAVSAITKFCKSIGSSPSVTSPSPSPTTVTSVVGGPTTITTTGPQGNIRTVAIVGTSRRTLTLGQTNKVSTYTTTGPLSNIRTVAVSGTVRSTLPIVASNKISTYTTAGATIVVSGTHRTTLGAGGASGGGSGSGSGSGGATGGGSGGATGGTSGSGGATGGASGGSSGGATGGASGGGSGARSTYTTTGPLHNIRTVVVIGTARSTLPIVASNKISTYTTAGQTIVVSGTHRSTLGAIKYITTTEGGKPETLAVMGGKTSTLAKGATETLVTSRGGSPVTLAVVGGKTSTITGGGGAGATGGSGGGSGGGTALTTAVGPILGLAAACAAAIILL